MRVPKFPKLDPMKAEEQARLKRDVVALRRQSLSWADIGPRIGKSPQRAHQLWQAALLEVPAQDVVEHRAEEVQLAQDAIADLMRIAKDTSVAERARVEAWNSICRWSEHRARMQGTNAPTRSVQTVITEDVVDARIAELNRELASNDPAAG